MPTQTGDKNTNPERCDAAHEAGHAVVGVSLGLQLVVVKSKVPGGENPGCEWDLSKFEVFQANSDEPGAKEQLEHFTRNFALMCFASRYAEALFCDISSDEQAEALHYDYLDAQRMRYYCFRDYFSPVQLEELEAQAKEMIPHYENALLGVIDRLVSGEALTHEQVRNIIQHTAEFEA